MLYSDVTYLSKTLIYTEVLPTLFFGQLNITIAKMLRDW